MVVATVVVVASAGGWAPNSAAAITIVLIAVLIGLPHGALDIAIGPMLARPVVFLASYVVAGGVIVGAWLLAPLPGLGVFLAASWFHFARGDADHHRQLDGAAHLLGIATAGSAIGLPLAMHSQTVAPLLSDLVLSSTVFSADQVRALGSLIAYPAIVCGVVAAAAAVQARRFAAVAELIALVSLASIVHPLVSFALYFALWHSPRHLISLDIDSRAVVPTLAATVATLIGALGAWQFMEPSRPAVIQVVFIGLAALTGPHLVVTELHRRAPSRPGLEPS